MLSFRSIPPGVLHLCCVIVAPRKWLVDDDDVVDDTATEVQTNFYLSQYYTVLTTKSKIIVVLAVVTIPVLYLVFAFFIRYIAAAAVVCDITYDGAAVAAFRFVAFVAFEDDVAVAVAVDVVCVFPFRLLLLLPLPAALDSYVDRYCCGIAYG